MVCGHLGMEARILHQWRACARLFIHEAYQRETVLPGMSIKDLNLTVRLTTLHLRPSWRGCLSIRPCDYRAELLGGGVSCPGISPTNGWLAWGDK